MPKPIKKTIALFILATTIFIKTNAQQTRLVQDISMNNWQLWLDTAAAWQNDPLFAPPANLKNLPVNLPTGGWAALRKNALQNIHLPATVEEFYWGQNGNKFGVSGNYLGVSWFTTNLMVPGTAKNKRLVLHFESVRFRAEIFVNKQLAGYDLVTGTPFDVDITDAVLIGKENEIAVRITDPNGNFDWRDSQTFTWGDYRTNPTHGFGGITGKVQLVVTDKVFISDIFIKNKPDPKEIDVQVTTSNQSGKAADGNFLFSIKENKTGKQVWQKQVAANTLQPLADNQQIISLRLDSAKLWDTDSPNLYTFTANWQGNNATKDMLAKRFGFRWFEIKDIDGDQQFYLNGKRIVLRTSISWGFWPVNGIAPSDELARKQIMDAKAIGLNMLNFHRTIGQQNVLDYADELGLLYFEEPGGNQFPANLFSPKNELDKKQADYYFAVRSEKFFRMIKRDRSHPSLIIYNMHNERGAEPQQQDKDEMLAGHKLDETRIMTYNSSNGDIKMGPDPKFKLHLLPYDPAFYDYGWFDQHHAGGPGVYHDALYSSPTAYSKYTSHANEIIYWGEEGAIGTPPRLQLIRDEILKTGKDIGWESDTYLKWYDAYNGFLHSSDGFLKAFPNVDSLTRKMGNVAYYYQGRTIENVRINNITDGYAVNGWESMKLENHSGMVDNYRNLKGDADLIARYNKPLYLAVKLNHKVLPVGDTTTIDLYIVNEKDIKGNFELELKATDNTRKQVWAKKMPVKVTGGSKYGELLCAGNKLIVENAGYTKISAVLLSGSKIIATGDDEVFAVMLNKNNIATKIMVADTSGILGNYFLSVNVPFKSYTSGTPSGNCLVVGAFEPQQTGNPLVTDLLEWVNNGNTLVIVNNTDSWASYLAKKEVFDYRGMRTMGTSWYGGNYFSKAHTLFNGLPQACVFNWEYQCFATYNKNRTGLRMFNGETVVGCVSDHKQEVYSALSIVPHGRGKIIICALDIFSCIKDVQQTKKAEGDGENASMNTFDASQKNKANIVGQQLLLNLLKPVTTL